MGKRRYCMPDPSAAVTDELLRQHIERGSRVIDLGCGDGRLLCQLRDNHDCFVQGIELDIDGILGSLARGLPIIRADLDQGLTGIPDQGFDYAVLSQTLQQVRHPSTVLAEMMRIATRALVVVPNFAHWKVRRQVVLEGRAPVTEALPYEWYNTPNLHFMSMRDFRDLTAQLDFQIAEEIPIIGSRPRPGAFAANLRAESLFYVVERRQK
ncbi:MAG: methionine biosynthesis protein MetW [Planctomycetota bacterium]|nr:methionine biosynthesis protein MetW [Planctomycetota bacterium]MDA1251736.1 methionine biosynthesis protein MetW [Planctomycetota bacterium]